MRAAAGALVLVLLGACSADSAPDESLAPVGSAATAASGSEAATASTATGPPGSGVVRVRVRLAGRGVDEVLLFDRSTVAASQLDAITLDADCTALDGGEPYTVSVVDLRRLTEGQHVLSATLVLSGDVAPGDHPATLAIGDSAQQTTHYEGSAVLDAGLASGTFELTATNGATASGSFDCAPDLASLPTTTTAAPLPPEPVDTTGPTGPPAPPATPAATPGA